MLRLEKKLHPPNGEAIAKGLGHQLGVAASNGVTIIITDAGRMEGQGQRTISITMR